MMYLDVLRIHPEIWVDVYHQATVIREMDRNGAELSCKSVKP